MPVVASVDYVTKRIYLSSETVNANVDMLDVYREVRAMRRNNEAHRKFRPLLIAGGNIEKIAGLTYTPAYCQLLYGARVVPFDSAHRLRLVRDTFTDDGFAGRDCFDRTGLASSVDIDVDFPEVEIRIVDGGGAGPTAAQIADAVWQRVLEGSLTAEQIQRLQLAVLTGGGTFPPGPGSYVAKSLDGTKDRVTGAVDVAGVRNVTNRDGT